jgi:hypothetical protein
LPVALFGQISRVLHLLKIRSYIRQLEEVIAVQSGYAQLPQEPFDITQYDPQEMPEQKDPTRFMPKPDPEADLDRWRKK